MRMKLDQLETPCLVLDEAKLEANVARMRAQLDRLGVALRPHLKTAKSIDVARRVLRHTDDKMLDRVYCRPRPAELVRAVAAFDLPDGNVR